MLLSSIVWKWPARMITFGLSSLNLKVFSKQVRELGVEVLARIQSDLVQNPERGAVVKGTHGVRKARVAESRLGPWKEWQLSISVPLS